MTLLPTSHRLGALACGVLALTSLPLAHAADAYPTRPISLVVGYPAGGSVDLTARLFAEALTERLGQNVMVENVGGAGGSIGAQRVARAKADGYTLLLGSTNEIVVASMINNAVNYDSARDFASLGIIGSQPMLLAASKNAGVSTAAEYLEKLRSAAPGTYYFGSSGVGTTLHLAGEMINASTETEATHVPYRGVAPLVTDLMGGQLTFGMLVLSSGLPPARNGNIVALGVTEAKRSPIAPEIPALAETPGFEDVDINIWFGLYAPSGVPEPVAETLRAALKDIVQDDTFGQKFATAGGDLAAPDIDAVSFLQAETEKYGALVKASGIEAQ